MGLVIIIPYVNGKNRRARAGGRPRREVHEEGTGCVTVPKIDVSKFIEQSGIRKARFGGYETVDVRQAMQALCTEYEQRLNRAESHAKALAQQNTALEQHCQNLTAQNRRLAEQSAALAGNTQTYSRQRTELDNRLASLKEKYHSLSDKCAVLQLKNTDLVKENEELKEAAAQARAELRIKGRELDDEKAAQAAARRQMLEKAEDEADKLVEEARKRAEKITDQANLEAQATARAAREQAQAQARKLVDAAAAEANEVQNAHQLRLNSLREEVRELEQRRDKLIEFLNRMARELMQVEGTAKSEGAAVEAEPAPAAGELPDLHEVPTPPVELDLGPEAIARAVDELRAQAAAGEEDDEPVAPAPDDNSVAARAARSFQLVAEDEAEEEPVLPVVPEPVRAKAPSEPKTEPEEDVAAPSADGPEPARQTGPALTEVPGAIFSSPIVRQETPAVPDEDPPAAGPQMPVMPSLLDEEDYDDSDEPATDDQDHLEGLTAMSDGEEGLDVGVDGLEGLTAMSDDVESLADTMDHKDGLEDANPEAAPDKPVPQPGVTREKAVRALRAWRRRTQKQ